MARGKKRPARTCAADAPGQGKRGPVQPRAKSRAPQRRENKTTHYRENLSCQLDTTSCFVDGLAPNTEYEVKVLAVKYVDDIYFSQIREGPASEPTRFKTLPSDVEITGVQTADERDEEAKKHAVDVDAADEPVAKRVKSEP